MTVLRRADGTLLAGLSVHQDGVIGCGARAVTPADPDYEELSAAGISEAERAAAADPVHPRQRPRS